MEELIIFVVEELIKQAPSLVPEFQQLFASGTPSADDWAALRARVNAKSYADYDPKPLPAAAAVPANVVPLSPQPGISAPSTTGVSTPASPVPANPPGAKAPEPVTTPTTTPAPSLPPAPPIDPHTIAPEQLGIVKDVPSPNAAPVAHTLIGSSIPQSDPPHLIADKLAKMGATPDQIVAVLAKLASLPDAAAPEPAAPVAPPAAPAASRPVNYGHVDGF